MTVFGSPPVLSPINAMILDSELDNLEYVIEESKVEYMPGITNVFPLKVAPVFAIV
jgi:hypothetical protein